MKDERLLNCPFCGSPARMSTWRYQDEMQNFMQYGAIICKGCGIRGKDWGDIRCETRHETINEERAIKAWNRRKGENE